MFTADYCKQNYNYFIAVVFDIKKKHLLLQKNPYQAIQNICESLIAKMTLSGVQEVLSAMAAGQNNKITKTGKIYLCKKLNKSVSLPNNAIPNFILKMLDSYQQDPVQFQTNKSQKYYSSCIAILRRYNLLAKENKPKARDNWKEYMRQYRNKKKLANNQCITIKIQ